MFSLRTLVAASICAAAFAACGGGGGSSPTPVTGGGGTGATATPSPSPAPSSSPAFTASYASQPALDGGTVQFSCGCASTAGTANVGADGSLAITQNSTGLPSGTYTIVSGRNYVIIGQAASSHLQYWTLTNLGTTSSTNRYLGPSNGSGVDNFTTLGALYVYYNTGTPANSGSSEAFDYWPFSGVQTWVDHMRAGTTDTAEAKALSDIAAAQSATTSLYPTTPSWTTATMDPPNALIQSDLSALASDTGDSTKPTECTSVCSTN